jgi:hypothetical protein
MEESWARGAQAGFFRRARHRALRPPFPVYYEGFELTGGRWWLVRHWPTGVEERTPLDKPPWDEQHSDVAE